MAKQFGWLAAALLAICAATAMTASPARAATQGIAIINGDFELPGPLGSKTVAFDSTGAALGNIPGWTFAGPGMEDFGHTDHENGDALGDSGTEGGGNPGNEMLLSTFDGVVYQTSSFSAVDVPSTQMYRLSFDAHDIWTPLIDGAPTYEDPQCQLTARLYYLAIDGTTRTTIGSPLAVNLSGFENYTIDFVGGSPDLTPALGRPIGVEFDTTSDVFNPTYVEHSWAGVDNVVLQIMGVATGDLNGDGNVDPTDYGIIRDNQQQATLFNAEGDMTGDGIVDLNDFRAFKTAYEAAHGSGSLAAALATAAVPEPSTLALMLVLAGALTWIKRGRLTGGARLAVLVVVGLVTAAAPASADLLFYDPFLIGTSPAVGEYVVDTSIVGQNPILPGSGYGTTPNLLTGAWDRPVGSTNDQAFVYGTPGLNYIGAPAEGGSAGTYQDPETYALDNRVGRFLSTPWDDTTVGTYYISWLENFGTITNDTDDMGYKAFEIWNADATASQDIGDAYLIADVGYNKYGLPAPQQDPTTARLSIFGGVQGGAGYTIIEGAPDSYWDDGATHLIVLKFTLSADAASDSISVFLDPTSVTEPELPSAVIAGQDITVGAVGFAQFGGYGPTNNMVDEIRFADSFAEALPTLPYPGDTDGDGDVDLVDYNNIVTHMNMQVSTALEGDVAKADGTQGSDGRVTIADFRIWKDHYPYPVAGAGTLAGVGVPEPASWLLLTIAALFAVGRCRRRG